MKYMVYRTDSELYLNTVNGVSWVREKECATLYKSESHANRQVKTYKGIYEDVTLVAFDGDEMDEIKKLKLSDVEVTLSEEDISKSIEDIKNYSTFLAKSISEVEQLIVYYKDEQKKCDMETQDILHKIELTDISYVMDAWKYTKMLQEVRRRRRIAKDNLAFLSCLINNGVLKIAKGVDRYNSNQETRTYTPRVLTELFEEEK